MDSLNDPGARRRLLRGLGMGLATTTMAGLATGSTPRTIGTSSAGEGPVDPRSHGARLDGRSDDSAALLAATRTNRPVLIDGHLRVDRPIDLPPDLMLIGSGVYRSAIILGPRGQLRLSGPSFQNRAGGASLRDLTIAPVNQANQNPVLELRHVHHILFDNVTFYRSSLVLDEHHYVTFRDCRFFGEDGKSVLRSTCDAQPAGTAAISECPIFTGCFFTSHPVELEDTVGPRFTDCMFFGGDYAIRSTRRLARGSAVEPFYMGPVVNGCVFDSINGTALEIEGGGTDCRLVNNMISGGRPTQKPGMVLTSSSGVELVGNRFEWCGSAGLVIDNSEMVGLVSNSFANIAAGPAIRARRSREVRVVGNVFENRRRWGGSAEGFTTLAIEDDAGSCSGWVITGNTASGLRDARISTVRNSLVQANAGWPPSTEQGWPSGNSGSRPRDVQDGYRWYDRDLGQWIHWHAGSRRWRDPTGRAL
jgi:hypothetical protein